MNIENNIKLWSSLGMRATFGLIAMELAKKNPDLMKKQFVSLVSVVVLGVPQFSSIPGRPFLKVLVLLASPSYQPIAGRDNSYSSSKRAIFTAICTFLTGSPSTYSTSGFKRPSLKASASISGQKSNIH